MQDSRAVGGSPPGSVVQLFGEQLVQNVKHDGTKGPATAEADSSEPQEKGVLRLITPWQSVGRHPAEGQDVGH